MPLFNQLIWRLPFRPIWVHSQLPAFGVDNPAESLFSLLFRRHPLQDKRRAYACSLLFHLLVVVPVFAFLFAFTLRHTLPSGLFDHNTNYTFGRRFLDFTLAGSAIGTAGGIITAVAVIVVSSQRFVGALLDLLSGIAFGCLTGFLTGLMMAIALDNQSLISKSGILRASNIFVGVVVAALVGFGGGSIHSLALALQKGVAVRGLHGLYWGFALGLVAFFAVLATTGDPVKSIIVLVVLAPVYWASLHRILPFYVFEFFWQPVIYAIERMGTRSLYFAPVLFHDLSFLRHPLLIDHLTYVGNYDPRFARDVCLRCLEVPGQRAVGCRVITHFQVAELRRFLEEGLISRIVDRVGVWLSVTENIDDMEKVSQLADALDKALSAPDRPERLARLDLLETDLNALAAQLSRTGPDYMPLLRLSHEEFAKILVNRRVALTGALSTTVIESTLNRLPIAPEPEFRQFRALWVMAGLLAAAYLTLNLLLRLKPDFTVGYSFLLSLVPIATIYLTYRALRGTESNLLLSKEGQISDRLIKALDILAKRSDGRPAVEVRGGGVYALERISFDSERDHHYVMEILAAYVRENASTPAVTTDATPLTSDVEAALRAIGRRDVTRERKRPIDLKFTKLHLCCATLAGGEFAGADFSYCDLRGADFTYANLRGCDFTGALLTGAIFYGADRQGALFDRQLSSAAYGFG